MPEQGQIDRKPNGDYRFDSSPGRGPSHAQVAVDEAGNFAVWTKGNPRGLAVVLRMIADEIEADAAGIGFGVHPTDLSPVIRNACFYCGWEHPPRDHSKDPNRTIGASEDEEPNCCGAGEWVCSPTCSAPKWTTLEEHADRTDGVSDE